MLYYSEEDPSHKAQKISQSKNSINVISAQNLRDKRYEILKNSSNSIEIEEEFIRICSAYNSDFSAHYTAVMQAYQYYINTYNQKTSLFNLTYENSETYLLIYNTNTEMQEESKILNISQLLDAWTCITQLPNGKLFCYGSLISNSGITLLIDENFQVEELPSGTACFCSSAIYFDSNVYCFGGEGEGGNLFPLSSRFDLGRNQWIELTLLPKADLLCNNVIFNGSILISGFENKNILRYSIENNSFTEIPYGFAEERRKILINAERLYLIECESGSIYESEIGIDTAWRRIANQSIIDFHPDQTYCVYNKRGIYINSLIEISGYACFKFDLSEKTLTKLI